MSVWDVIAKRQATRNAAVVNQQHQQQEMSVDDRLYRMEGLLTATYRNVPTLGTIAGGVFLGILAAMIIPFFLMMLFGAGLASLGLG